MKDFFVSCAMVLALGIAGTACTSGVDFERTGLSEGDTLTTQVPGLTFIGAMIAEPGSPSVAFTRNAGTGADDTAVGGQPFSGFFVTDLAVGGDTDIPGTIVIEFLEPVSTVSFYVADLDIWAGGYEEVLTAQPFDATGTPLLQPITITAGEPGTGDGIATLIRFDIYNISRITVRVDTEINVSGWGLDNLSFSESSMGPCVGSSEASFYPPLGSQ